ncbi:MAG TPA: VCBS repeat-containing protein [Vicinamibacterales bacterium]|nr:VCBS repeat-containing protein [Vicinamibacterales bacterium]
MLVLVGVAGPGYAQTIDMGATSDRELWRGEAASRAGVWLDRGELNTGDTRRDLIVGAPDWSAGRGRVYVHFSGPVLGGELQLANAAAIFTGAAAGDLFGTSTAAGYITRREVLEPPPLRDLVVGAPGANGGRGAVYLFLGGISHGARMNASAATLTVTGAAGDALGAMLATADLDGDGFREILIGAPGNNRVYAIKGGAGVSGTIDLATTPAYLTLTGPAGVGFGSVLAAGNLTGDTAADLAIGVPGLAPAGGVYILKGRPGGGFPSTLAFPAAADAILTGVDPGDRAGAALDINMFDGDLIDDLMIGAPDADGPANVRVNAGEVYVVWGSATFGSRSLATADVTYFGANPGDRLGTDLATGNVDRLSTIRDLAILAPDAGSHGQIHVVLGRPRAEFAPSVDLATGTDILLTGDTATGRLQAVLIYDHTGEGSEDIVGGVPDADAAAGRVYISMSAVPSVLTSPDRGSTISSSTVRFEWDAGTRVSGYWIDVGTARGGYELYSNFVGNSRSLTLNNIPLRANGSVWVRLRSLIHGRYEIIDESFRTATPEPAVVTSPAPGSTLSSRTQTFQWSSGTGVSGYWIDIGTVQGGYELFSGYVGTTRAVNISNVPLNGGPLWVRVRSLINGSYQIRDASFVTATPRPAQITSPAVGSSLAGSTQTFTWGGGVGVQFYWVNVGSTQGGYEYFSNFVGDTQAVTVSGLPIDGRSIWVRLMSYINGAYQFVDHRFVAAVPGPARITNPAAGATLSGATQTFTWSPGVGAQFYWVNVGSTQGGYEYYSNYVGNTQAVTVTGLPIDGRPIWVRLMSYINGAYQFVDHQFRAATPTPSRIISPVPGTALTSSTTTFSWDQGVGVQYYWVNIGRVQGGYDLYSNYVGQSRSLTMNGLPIDGGEIWVRLYSFVNGAYQFVDHRFTTQQP